MPRGLFSIYNDQLDKYCAFHFALHLREDEITFFYELGCPGCFLVFSIYFQGKSIVIVRYGVTNFVAQIFSPDSHYYRRL